MAEAAAAEAARRKIDPQTTAKRARDLKAENRRLRRRIDAITAELVDLQQHAADCPDDADDFDQGIAEGTSFAVARILSALDEESQSQILDSMGAANGVMMSLRAAEGSTDE